MKKPAKRWARLLLALFAVLVCAGFAAPLARADYYPYEILHYGVEVETHENNTYSIVETLDVFFNEERHGIYRDIPLRFGGNRTAVTDVEVEGGPVLVQKYPTYIRLKIGDADTTITGNQTYHISYTLNLGKDQAKGFDTVYLNLIGAYWDAPIWEADFTVHMFTDFSLSDVSMVQGSEGAASSTHLIWQADGDTITGRTTQLLSPYEGVTLKVDLPEGAFTGDNNAYDPFRWTVMILAALTVGGALTLWLLYGRDPQMAPVVEFKAPDGFSPAEVGYIIDEKVDNEDLSAMFIYWASHGHMRIEELPHRKFRLIKLSDLDEGHPAHEKTAFNGLWTRGSDGIVEAKDLKNSYYTVANTFRSKTASVFTRRKKKRLYDKKSDIASGIIAFMSALCFWTLCMLWAWMSSEEFLAGAMLACFMTMPYYLFAMGWKWIQRRWRRNSTTVKVLTMVAMIFITLFLLLLVNVMSEESLTPFERNTLLLASLAAILLRPFIRKRTPWGHALTERVLGFRQFMMDAERDRIEQLMDENPQYFYDVLPYAIALGVTNKWAHKFEGLLTQPPDWYQPHSMSYFSTSHLVNSLSRTTQSVNSMATSSPSSSGSGGGGGGFSGGGSVGGGGGGGGGGSW